MIAQTKMPMTVASWERTERTDGDAERGEQGGAGDGAGDVAHEGAGGEGDVVAVAGDEGEPDAGGNDSGDQSEERPDAGRGDYLGEEHACPLWGGEVGEGGRGVAELAVGDDRSEHGGEEHGEAGNGGHSAQPVGRGDRGDAAAAVPALLFSRRENRALSAAATASSP